MLSDVDKLTKKAREEFEKEIQWQLNHIIESALQAAEEYREGRERREGGYHA